jgi:hypothetical protein
MDKAFVRSTGSGTGECAPARFDAVAAAAFRVQRLNAAALG